MTQNVILCIDNSLASANGDFPPSRLRVQQEAAYEIAQLRLEANGDNRVAVIAMAGPQGRPDVVLALSRNTSEMQRRLFALTPSNSTADPITSLRIAQLMFSSKKKNKKFVARVIIFLGSTLQINQQDKTRLDTLARDLANNEVFVEVVAFGSPDETRLLVETFESFINKCKQGNQLVTIEPMQDFLAGVFSQLNSLVGQGRVFIPGLMGPTDDEADPELMMAIQMSIQEANQAANRAKETSPANTSDVSKGAPTKVSQPSKEISLYFKSSNNSNNNTSKSSPIKAAETIDQKQVAPQTNIGKDGSFKMVMPKTKRPKTAASIKTTGSIKTVPPVPLNKMDVKRKVKRKESFASFNKTIINSLNAGGKTSMSFNSKRASPITIKRQTTDRSRYALTNTKTTHKDAAPMVPLRNKITAPKNDEASQIRKELENAVVRKISATDFYANLKAKLSSTASHNSKLIQFPIANGSTTDLFQLKLNSWIFRNPDLFPKVAAKDSSFPFIEQRPLLSGPSLSVNRNKIQEMINAKMRALNIASSCKIVSPGTTGQPTTRLAESPLSGRKRATSPGSFIMKINADNRLVVKKQAAPSGDKKETSFKQNNTGGGTMQSLSVVADDASCFSSGGHAKTNTLMLEAKVKVVTKIKDRITQSEAVETKNKVTKDKTNHDSHMK